MKIRSMIFLMIIVGGDIYTSALDQLGSSLRGLQRQEVKEEYIGNAHGEVTYSQGVRYTFGPKDIVVTIKLGDFLEQGAETVVDAADTTLELAGGVSGLLKGKAKEYLKDKKMVYKDFINEIWKKTRTAGNIPTGSAWFNTNSQVRVQNAAKNKSMPIIHAVAPQCSGGVMSSEVSKALKSSYFSSLVEADKHTMKSIAFPLLGAGIYGCDSKEAFSVSAQGIVEYIYAHPETKITTIDIVIFPQKASSDTNDPATRQKFWVESMREAIGFLGGFIQRDSNVNKNVLQKN